MDGGKEKNRGGADPASTSRHAHLRSAVRAMEEGPMETGATRLARWSVATKSSASSPGTVAKADKCNGPSVLLILWQGRGGPAKASVEGDAPAALRDLRYRIDEISRVGGCSGSRLSRHGQRNELARDAECVMDKWSSTQLARLMHGRHRP